MGNPAVVAGLAKAIVGRIFRPTYALANVGTRPVPVNFASTQALQGPVWISSSESDMPGLVDSLTEVAIRITM
jgi:hypothetical protein